MNDWFANKNILLVAAIIAVAAIWLGNHGDNETAPKTASPPLLVVKDGQSYRYDENGKNDTILTATITTHYQDERGTQFIKPHLTRFNGDVTTTLDADYAVENKQRTVIDMQGHVVGQRKVEGKPTKDTLFESERLIYRIPENEAENDLPLTITTPESKTHAIGTLWHLNQNLCILKKNVRSLYASAKSR